jgi:hypothetical protein
MNNNIKCIRDRETTVYMAKVIKFPQLSIPWFMVVHLLSVLNEMNVIKVVKISFRTFCQYILIGSFSPFLNKK